MHILQLGEVSTYIVQCGRILSGACFHRTTPNDRLIINRIRVALEAASLQWMEGEKELSMRTPMPLTTFATYMELPGLPVAKDN